jgi:hypothetical protein
MSGCSRWSSAICGEYARKLLRVGRLRSSRSCGLGTVNPSRKLRRSESFTCHNVLRGPPDSPKRRSRGPFVYLVAVSKPRWDKFVFMAFGHRPVTALGEAWQRNCLLRAALSCVHVVLLSHEDAWSSQFLRPTGAATVDAPRLRPVSLLREARFRRRRKSVPQRKRLRLHVTAKPRALLTHAEELGGGEVGYLAGVGARLPGT